MKETTKVSNETYFGTLNENDESSFSQRRNAIEIFKNTLNFLSFAMNRQNISQEQYSTIHDEFIR